MLEKEGVTLDCDMYAKLRELFDDPAMTDAKWREWLPVFEFADAEVRRKCLNLWCGHNAEYIKKILNDDYQPLL